MSTIEALEKKLDKSFHSNEAWKTFVRDHKKEIIDNSSIIILSGEILDRFDHKLPHLLESNKCLPQHVWIAVIINNIKAYESLYSRTALYIPNHVFIDKLYTRYKNSITSR